MFQQMFAHYFKVAESAIQFQHDLLRQWSGQWPTPPVADGRTQPLRAMQKKAREESSEMLDLQRELLALVTRSETRLLDDVSGMANAAALGGRHREEGTVGTRGVQETERVGGEVRKEEMRVVRGEREQDVDRHSASSGNTTMADGDESRILHHAYLKWLEEGRPEGQDRRHYFEALQRAPLNFLSLESGVGQPGLGDFSMMELVRAASFVSLRLAAFRSKLVRCPHSVTSPDSTASRSPLLLNQPISPNSQAQRQRLPSRE